MNDFVIKVSKLNRSVTSCESFIGLDGENLVENLIFIFTDTFVDGNARLEYIVNDEKYFIELNKGNNYYSIPIKNVITKEGNIEMQLVISKPSENNEIIVFKSDIFTVYCKKSINAVEDAPDGYVVWLDHANEILRQMENLNIIAYKENGITYIVVTSKEGVSTTYQIKDGKNGRNGLDGEKGEDGNGIIKIEKTGTQDNVDTYTIYYTNGTTSTFTVTNSTVTDEEFNDLEDTVTRYKTLSNLLPRVNGTDTDLSLSNTGNEVMMDTSLSGQTSQESTSGKNLFGGFTFSRSSANVNFTTNKDGSITMTGTATATTYSLGTSDIATYKKTLEAGTYTLSGGTSSINLVVTDTSGTNIYNTSGNTSVTFTLNNSTDIVIRANVPNGTTTNTTLYPMLSTNGGDYEPYTGGIPAPNPSYPYPINKATGNQNVKIENKNLVNQNNAEINKKIFSSGAYTSPTGTNTTDYIYIGNFTNITIIHDGTDGNWNTCYFDENKNVVSGGGNGYSNSKQIFSVGDKKYIKFSYATTCQPALYGDLDISTYVSHQEQNFPITLGSLEAYDTDEFVQNSGKNLISSVARSNNVLYFNGSNENVYPFKAGTYTFSYSDTNNCSLYYKTANTSSTSLGQNKTVTFTINEDFNVWLYRSGMTDNEVTNIMLNEGTSLLPYEPYGTDEWYLKNYFGKVVLDGSEEWNAMGWSGGKYAYRTTISNLKQTTSTASISNVLSNYYKAYSQNDVAGNYNYAICNRANQNEIIIRNDDCTSRDNFKSWLSSNNTTVVYELSTPTFTKITDTTLIGQLNDLQNNARSYADVTNITVTGNLPLIISASAYRDLTKLFESEGE